MEAGKGYWIPAHDIDYSAEFRIEAIGSYCEDPQTKSKKGIREKPLIP